MTITERQSVLIGLSTPDPKTYRFGYRTGDAVDTFVVRFYNRFGLIWFNIFDSNNLTELAVWQNISKTSLIEWLDNEFLEFIDEL